MRAFLLVLASVALAVFAWWCLRIPDPDPWVGIWVMARIGFIPLPLPLGVFSHAHFWGWAGAVAALVAATYAAMSIRRQLRGW